MIILMTRTYISIMHELLRSDVGERCRTRVAGLDILIWAIKRDTIDQVTSSNVRASSSFCRQGSA